MTRKILLNGNEYEFNLDNLPCLIHGEPGTGTSMFTVSLMAQLFERGNKLLILSGYQMAIDELATQISTQDLAVVANMNDLENIQVINAKVVFMLKDQESLLEPLLKTISNVSQRVILIKNFSLFAPETINHVKNHERLVLSGNLDKCEHVEQILDTNFQSKVMFSDSKSVRISEMNDLDQYQGYLKSGNDSGRVQVAMD